MSRDLTPGQLEFYRRVDEILYYKWDPIGISNSDWARDEYQSYLPQVFDIALQHDSPQRVAEYLTSVSTESMGLPAAGERDLAIGKLILEIKTSLGL